MIFRFRGKYYRTTEKTETIAMFVTLILVILGSGYGYM